ncbi:TRAP transporter substrate-binding protein [Stutzerimonas stutzeri]|uniref:TRAP transporter substrate-binding protein n=1 Tax=Stutzerimonas stutzeri TaxID=316 RepID=UPI0021096D15|nr:TRAP transporter substrate-binding protein [Stutzerimonas stutzeri]MCQ4259455.1 TRAP transporter substrate-binding protein [Stutzerimonas stutzeri]
MNNWLKTLTAAVCATGLAVGSLQAHAADYRDHTLRFAFQNVKDHPQGLGAQKFADLVSEKSGGKMKVRLFAGGTLGGDLQTVSALQGGTLDVTVLNSGILAAQVPDFALFDFPFLFESSEQAYAVMDGPVGQELGKRLESKGLIGLGYWDLGFRQVTNNSRAITGPKDLEGLKIRVIQSPIYLETFKALGANPVPMPFPEVYTGLEQRTVDGQENPFTVIEGSKFNEVQKYLSATNHIYNPQSLIIGQKTWNRLNADEQALIREAATEATQYQREITQERQGQALESLKQSMEFNEVDKQALAAFREKVKPVIEQFSKDIDPALLKTLHEAVGQ